MHTRTYTHIHTHTQFAVEVYEIVIFGGRWNGRQGLEVLCSMFYCSAIRALRTWKEHTSKQTCRRMHKHTLKRARSFFGALLQYLSIHICAPGLHCSSASCTFLLVRYKRASSKALYEARPRALLLLYIYIYLKNIYIYIFLLFFPH